MPTYFKVPLLFKNSNDGLVNLSNKLVSLRLPEVLNTQLQLFHENILQFHKCK